MINIKNINIIGLKIEKKLLIYYWYNIYNDYIIIIINKLIKIQIIIY